MCKPFHFTFILSLTFFACLSFANTTETKFARIQVEVNQQTLPLEYANTFELRAQGLMFREEMCDDCGMLFKFEFAKHAGMWMKNTLIPLDVAFIRADGKITDIKAMQPHDLRTTSSSEAVLYAWEMNQGWFAQNDIKVGDKITLTQAD